MSTGLAPVECHLVLAHSDFVMQNHRVHGVSVMPGVTFLDIVFRILAAQGVDTTRAVVRDVLFHEAMVTTDGHDRDVRVRIDAAGTVTAASRWLRDGEPVSEYRDNFQAVLAFSDEPEPAPVDLAALRAGARVLDMDELYARARAEEIRHGDAMRCFGELHIGPDYLVAELSLDAATAATDAAFHLHPAKLDSSTLAAFGQAPPQDDDPFIPVYVGEFRAPRPITGRVFAVVPQVETIAESGDVMHNDYTIVDEHGRFLARFGKLTCKRIRFPGLITRLLDDVTAAGPAGLDDVIAHLRGMVARALGVEPAAVDTKAGFYNLGLDSTAMLGMSRDLESYVGASLYPTLLFEFSDIAALARHLHETYQPTGIPTRVEARVERPADLAAQVVTPVWAPQAISRGDAPTEVVLVGGTPALAAELGKHVTVLPEGSHARHYVLVAPEPTSGDIPAAYSAFTRLAKSIMDLRPEKPVRLVFAHPGGAENAAVAALARTVTAETPILRARAVETTSADAILAELADPEDESEVRYRATREVIRFAPARTVPGKPKHHGVYVITGGAGGLGALVADRLAREVQARLLLIGRSSLSAELAARIADWEALGARVQYVRADVANAAEVTGAVATARAMFGRVDGVFHCAGVVRDGLYFRKGDAGVAAVLAAKVAGTRNLVAATEDADLFVVFSSVSATLANIGQSDYAYGNAYAEHLVGDRGLVVGWPFWAEGGMRVGDEVIARAGRDTGTWPLPTDTGLDLLWGALGGTGRIVVSYGEPARVAALFPAAPEPVETTPIGDIAIIGIAGQYPQAPDLTTFWHNLADGVDSVAEIPGDRWAHAEFFHPEKGTEGRTYSRWGGFLDGVDLFDPAFFGISRREAERMDPQERLFLKTAWRAVENAGYRPDGIDGETVGVFVGVMWNHYQLLADRADGVHPTAMHCTVANRVSYCLDLGGPSMAVDTACSSSLTAIHLAVESLRRGQSTMAIAGGVNVSVHPQKYLQLAAGQFLSTDGRCRSFGAGGSGYVPGEGVGAVVLKPLAKALADGDFVFGVIKGTELNHTGKGSGYTVPNPAAQAAVIRAAVERSGVPPRTIGYLEAHGTGTSLGDPIEIEGIRQAFGDLPPGGRAIGSVKSNIGHLESAAGIAGLTKVVMQMLHRELVPSLHADTLNPHIDFASSPFAVQRTRAPWHPVAGESALRAGVSAFGAGGANAHVVLESAPPPAPPQHTPGPHLFVLSARDSVVLRAYTESFVDLFAAIEKRDAVGDPALVAALVTLVADVLGVPEDAVAVAETLADLGVDAVGLDRVRALLAERAPDTAAELAPSSTIAELTAHAGAATPSVSLVDIVYTVQTGRPMLAERVAVLARDSRELRIKLETYLAGERAPGLWTGRAAGDGPSRERLAELFRAGELAELADLWVAGADVPWTACYQGVSRRRLPLPTYPFREERYWIGEWKQAAATPTVGTDRAGITDAIEEAVCARLYLRRDELDRRQSFNEMGLESVGAVEIARGLGERFGVEIDSVAVYDHPTIDALATHILALGPTAQAVARTEVRETAARDAPIAVIGMSGRFPDAENLDQFWANLAAGRHSFRDVPKDRWDVEAVFDPNRLAEGRTYSRTAAMLSDVDKFDAAFFNLSPLEAEAMDPQQRLFLQQAWAGLEDAGYAVGRAEKTSCGVFVGCAPGDYSLLLAEAGRADSGHAFLGTTSSILPARIGYLLNLDGPTMAIDTACSSSLVAVHLAADAIRRGECAMAVAGGVALMVTPQLHVRGSKVGMLSPNGRCVPFDASADGTVLGEGVGVVVLKRLDAALADGDRVHGVLLASGVNGDGKTNGITAPSAASQAALVADVYRRAGVNPREISYVEAHGTGTALGDPIEVKALTEVHRRHTDDVGYCAIGSVKANIGHTTMAAGIAGLLKVLLALRHGELPPAPAFDAPNPKTDLDTSPFAVVRVRREWTPGPSGTRLATVSSFGFSGTNAHLLVAEPPRPHRSPEQGEYLIPVSARTESALAELLARLRDTLTDDLSIADVAFTLGAGRTHFRVRTAFVATSVADLREQLAGSTRELPTWAKSYVDGEDPVWPEQGHRVPLPTYPFARDRHWVEQPRRDHPFLGEPVDGVFTATLSPADWIVGEHRIGGHNVLPGAAGLDLATEAALRGGIDRVRLSDVRWLRLFEADTARTLRLRLDGQSFTLYGDDPAAPSAQGTISRLDADEETVDVAAIRTRCAGSIPAHRHYEDFAASGIDYGPAFRVLTEIAFGPDEALGTLTLPPGTDLGFALHPNLLDGAQQTVAALEAQSDAPLIPFSIDSVDVLHPRVIPAYSHVVRADGDHTYMVRLISADGQVCVRYHGFSLREQRNPMEDAIYVPVFRDADPVVAATPAGRVAVVHTAEAGAFAAQLGGAVTVVVPDTGDPDFTPLDGPLDTVYFVARVGDPGVAPERDRSTLALFRLVKRFLDNGRAKDRLTIKIVLGGALCATPDEPIRPHAAGLLGLARAIAAECPKWTVGCVDVGLVPVAASRVLAEPGTPDVVLLRGDRRLTRVFEPTRLAPPVGAMPFVDDGVYLLIGGAGGIGFALSRLLARIARAKLVWVGRSPLGPDHQRKIDEIAALGGEAMYVSADVADESALRGAVALARARFGSIKGAVHAALDLRDRTIANMDVETFEAGLAPKVAGCTTLASVLEAEPLDFLLIFSSAVSFVEAGGQANYAAASAFEDSYARWLGQRRPYPVSVVNWGFWGSVGAVATDKMRAVFAGLGVESIEPADGMAALRRVINARLPQALVMKGDRDRLPLMGIEVVGGTARKAAPVVVSAPVSTAPADTAGVRAYLRKVFGEVLKSDPAGLDEYATFENFGVDSLVSLNIINRFEQDLGDLPSTLLFEHLTIEQLADHLVETHTDALSAVVGKPAVPAEVSSPPVTVSLPAGDLGHSRTGYTRLEGLSRALFRQAFAQWTGRPEVGRPVAVTELIRTLGVRADYHRLFRAVLAMLVQDGHATADGDTFTLLDGTPGSVDVDGFLAEFPELAGHIRLLRTCVDALAEVLDGRRNAMDVLFPKGSAELVEAIYRGQAVSDYYNGLLAAGVVAHATRTPGMTRVVEIGAGTGASSVFVLPALRESGADVEYHYTDISPSFLRLGERAYGPDNPFMRFRLLDVEDDPVVHGFEAGGYDVAFGTHVLHATKDIRATLANIAKMLRPGGTVLINEVTRRSDFLTLTFGQTGGWWRYTDDTRVEHAPLLSPARWREVLADAGFRVVRTDGYPGTAPDELEQCLLVAEKLPEADTPKKEAKSTEDIAIIGVTGRYPGSPDLDTFWRNLSEGRSGITEIPVLRWDWREHFDPDRTHANTAYSRWGGFLDGIEDFDAGLFGILPRDAAHIDPQERLFLETCWELLEGTGYLGDASREPATGVFAGLMYGGYGLLAAAEDWPRGEFATGHSAYWSVANRVSYVFDFTGPSFAVDSACSSSLTALHLAAESLRRGECRMAIAGGVNLITHPAHFAALCARNMLASGDGCRVFDAGADGFVPGEGVGAVLLKPLADAIADGDTVWAVLKGSSLNAGGKTSGYTVPNPNAQAALITDALDRSGVDPATITYVEAHGTGTALGDPIELTALSKAYGTGGPIAVGSVKSNIGHLEGAAGIAGLTKLLLQLRHRALAPTINLDSLNPKIDLGESRFRPQTTAAAWVSNGPRRAGMSSFGAGGANAHVILEEHAGAPFEPDQLGVARTFVLSARTEAALREHAARVAEFLPTTSATLRDLAFTSQVGRRAQPRRVAFVVVSKEELGNRLAEFARSGIAAPAEEAWVGGARIDWRERWTGQSPRRVYFPTSVFERRRHWITDDPRHLAPASPTVATAVPEFDGTHPLLAVAADHVLAGERWVPGVALLEIARLASGVPAPLRVADVRWVAPVNLDSGSSRVEVSVAGTAFTVHDGGTTFARGVISSGGAAQSDVDIAAAIARCDREVSVSSFYEAFSRTGLDYGPALRVVRSLRVGRGEALAELETTLSGHVLDPSLLDGALQTLSSLCSGSTGYLPVGLSAVTVTAALPCRCWARVRETTPPGRINGHRRFDVALTDETGRVAQALAGVEIAPRRTEQTEVRYSRPMWTVSPLVEEAVAEPRTLLVAGDPGLRAELADRYPETEVVVVESGDRARYREQVAALVARGRVPDAIVAVGDCLEPVLWLSAAVLERDRGAALRVVAVSAADEPEQVAVAGTLRTLALEHSRFAGVQVRVSDRLADRVMDELRALRAGAAEARYVDGVRETKSLARFEPPEVAAPTVRADGTYLITGGAGALGLHFAAFLAERGAGAVVLVGRSELDSGTAARVAGLGERVSYRRVDLADPGQVTEVVRAVGPLHGVIHAAGVTRDARAVVKTEEQVAAVLAPKVAGTRALDEATRGEPLDFFVVFSSVSGEAGNPGQADYAYANAFLNAFAARRTGPGRTLSIGWPLWAEGGMTVDEATVTLFARVWDMVPLSTRAGFEAFVRGLASDEPSLVVVEGPVRAPAPAPMAPVTPVRADRAALERELRGFASAFLLVDESDVDVRAELLELGFDSITLTELVNRVNERFGLDLLPTVLFECPDLVSFADYLWEHHAAELAPTGAVDVVPQAAPAGLAEQAGPAEAADRPEPVEVAERARPVVLAERAGPGESAEQACQAESGESVAVAEQANPVGLAPEPRRVAIVGIAGVMPGSADVHEFWERVAAGEDLVRGVPEDRADLLADPESRDARGGFLDGIDRFDAKLFGISPKEAAVMDPQQRLFLQTAWRAVEDAGYRPSDLAGSETGVFAGVATTDYDELLKEHGVEVQAHTATGIAHSVLANRVSYLLDLRGPSETADTACSSSLVAIHRAVRSIQAGECAQAIAGGVNVILSPGLLVAFTKSGMLSPDGKCKTFDAGADGYVRGEGAGAVLLKPLDAAVADGDHVYAVVRGSAVNHGGRGTSLTAPNPEAQARVLVRAHRDAGVDPDTVTYIEAHGTGTRLGDPIEAEGLKKAFTTLYADRGRPLPDRPHIALGTVKTNIGHLEAAAGIAGVLKVVLAMRHRELPATLHYREPNPFLRLDSTPIAVNDRRRPWTPVLDEGAPVLRAGVSSFGFGGTNAHLVLENAVARQASADTRRHLFPLSAPDAESLAAYAAAVARHLEDNPDDSLAAVAHTLQTGRSPRPERLVILTDDRAVLITRLRALDGVRGTAMRGATPATGQESEEDLARQWVAGAEIPWRQRWSDHNPGRVPLPPVPFAPTRHWFETPTPPAESTPQQPTGGRAMPSPRPRGPKIVLSTPAGKSTQPPAARAPRPVAQTPAPTAGVSPSPIPEPPAVSGGSPAVRELLRDKLAEILALPAEEIADDSSFIELGLDSIFRMDFARLLNTALGTDLKASELYEYDTIDQLAAFVATVDADNSVDAVDTRVVALSGNPVELVHRFIADELGREFDPAISFTDNGFSSFDMLRVVDALEKRFGALRKTLLFDHPTVAELTTQLDGDIAAKLAAPATPNPGIVLPAREGGWTVLEKDRLPEQPEFARIIADLERDHGREGGLPGRDIAPLVFLGSERKGYFNFSRRDEVIFSWSYVGPEEHFPRLAREYVDYAQANGLQPNLLGLDRLEDAEGIPFTATPFGALQRLDDLSTFTTQGSKMQRLRYVLNKFERSGRCSLTEYQVGSDPATDHRITEIIDAWATNKPMVNPYVHTVHDEIARGVLAPRHRMFLTRVGERIVSAVIVTKIPSQPGYLLDLEFYVEDMPLGGLEWTVVRIIEQTRAEGCTVFSFGGSFGAKVANSPNADPDLEAGLAELRSQGIFTGDGNFRFKNKFRTTNQPVYLCRPANLPNADVATIILMIANPANRAARQSAPSGAKNHGSDISPLAGEGSPVLLKPEAKPVVSLPSSMSAAQPPARVVADLPLGDRERLLAEHGHNPLRIPAEHIEFDLLTDSWAELAHPACTDRRADLHARQAPPIETTLPFDCVVPTTSGKSAEAALCRAWPRRGVVLHNNLFPSWYFSQLDHGLRPRLLGLADQDGPFTGDLDVEGLDAALDADTAFVCVETANNAQGGAPISLGNLTRVAHVARRHGVPLVLDATRVVENAIAIAAHEPGQQGRDLWDVVTDVLMTADAVTLSLSKDFGVDFGGVVATSHPEVAHHLRERIALRGHEVGLHGRALLAAALADRAWVAEQATRRVTQVRALRTALEAAGAPVHGTADGHCVLLDVGDLDSVAGHAHPVQAFLTALYRATGIRAAAHLSTEDSLVRLAVPVGTPEIDTVTARLLKFLADPAPIADLLPASADTGPLAAYHPAEQVPADIREAMAEGHQARGENLEVLREYNPDVRRQVLTLPDGDVEVFTAGTGRTLLFMLPFNIGAGVFGPQFASLAQRYRVTVVHHPGVGATTAARDLTYDGIAELTRQALDALGVTGPIHVAGASFGGLTAQVFALRYPEYTASLTLLCSSYKLGNRAGEVNRLAVVAKEDLDHVVRQTGSARLRADRARLEELLLRSESMDPRTGLRYLDVFAAQPNLLARLPEIAAPTLIVQGRHDTVIPLKTAHLLHGSIEDSRYHEVADAGHWPNLTSPDETNRVIGDFLAERDALSPNGSSPHGPVTIGAS
ncbi:SDR family NAD(P)-dependent oxidoreductase [Actinokineospora iranica]|uniref:Acyl transferase domain-containing protein n=1 Tax=Actinokineospora iranica TaxID=1271860 RepID=A0A1G6W884_9PSEU|nr:SDR family NAD(P)-dependent oxidoreductase [Actinokineospora iranica]SDD61903.1 Acyl transferase domain-containing protein [Actinokineospora iranica]